MITLKLDLYSEYRKEMYNDLCEKFGEDEVHEVLESQCIEHITIMFDNREQLEVIE